MTDHSHFLAIAQNNPAVSERLADLTEKAISAARENHGVALEPADVLDLREVRLAAMGAELDSDALAAELLALPALSTAAKRKAIEEGDEKARADAVADLNRGKAKENPNRRTAHAARRLSEARELGIATPPPAQDDMSKNERLEMLKDISNPAERVSLARKWGLV